MTALETKLHSKPAIVRQCIIMRMTEVLNTAENPTEQEAMAYALDWFDRAVAAVRERGPSDEVSVAKNIVEIFRRDPIWDRILEESGE